MQLKRKTQLKLVYAIVIEIVVFAGAYVLWLEAWIDPSTLVSVVIADLAIAVLLYYLFGERRRGRLDELLNIAEANEKFSHLSVYKMKGYGNFEDYFYVENKFTKKVYQSPDFLKEAIDCKIIPVIGEIFENKSALMTVMKEKGFTLIDRDATINELLAKE